MSEMFPTGGVNAGLSGTRLRSVALDGLLHLAFAVSQTLGTSSLVRLNAKHPPGDPWELEWYTL